MSVEDKSADQGKRFSPYLPIPTGEGRTSNREISVNMLELAAMATVVLAVLLPISTSRALRLLLRERPMATIGEAARGLAIAMRPRLWPKGGLDRALKRDGVLDGLSAMDAPPDPDPDPDPEDHDQAATG
jgi:hypothetical protein